VSKLIEFVIEVAVKAADAVSGLGKIESASDKTKAGLNRAGEAAEKAGYVIGSAMRIAAKGVSLMVTAATPALLSFGRQAIEASRSAEEAASKFAAVFDKSSKKAQSAADKLAKAQGRSIYQTRESVGDLAALAKGYGLTSDEAANFAVNAQRLGVDLASFHDQSDADALLAIRSAMSGEFEPLAGRAGIKLSAEQIDNELKLLGISKKKATNAEKLKATMGAIEKAAKKQNASGDAERTKGSRSNLKKTAEGSKYDASVEAGNKLGELDRKVQILKGDLAGLFLGLSDGGQTAVLAIGGVIAVLSSLGTVIQAVAVWKLMSATATAADTTATAADTTATAANTGGLWANIAARARSIAISAVNVARWIASTVATGANTAALWLNTAAQRAWAFGSALVAGAARLITTAFNVMKLALLSNPIIAIVAAIGAAAYLIYNNWGAISAWFAGIWAAISSAASAGWEFIKAKFNDGIAWLSALPGRMLAIGQGIMSGLVNGISSGAAWVRDKIMGLASQVSDWFKNALGINSPSLVFAGFGGNITDGLAQGLDKTARTAIKASQRIANAVADPHTRTITARLATNVSRLNAPAYARAGVVPSLSRSNPVSNDNRVTHQGSTIHAPININGARDPKSVAREVGRELDRRAYSTAIKSNK
jgi:hypothetical protein